MTKLFKCKKSNDAQSEGYFSCSDNNGNICNVMDALAASVFVCIIIELGIRVLALALAAGGVLAAKPLKA